MPNNTITFINKPEITSLSPLFGFPNATFTLGGNHLEDTEHVYFVDVFGNKKEAVFQVEPASQFSSLKKIVGTVPLLDGTASPYQIRAENSLGFSDKCCFESLITTQTTISNISGDDIVQIDDKYAVNAEISNAPTNTQGFEVLAISYTPVSAQTKLVVSCELSLQSSFWGAAVVALFKGDETQPRKVWNYALQGTNFGQIAKLAYVASSSSTTPQTWRVRLGRAENTYPIIYLNRNAATSIPYSGRTNSFVMVTEIDSP